MVLYFLNKSFAHDVQPLPSSQNNRIDDLGTLRTYERGLIRVKSRSIGLTINLESWVSTASIFILSSAHSFSCLTSYNRHFPKPSDLMIVSESNKRPSSNVLHQSTAVCFCGFLVPDIVSSVTMFLGVFKSTSILNLYSIRNAGFVIITFVGCGLSQIRCNCF